MQNIPFNKFRIILVALGLAATFLLIYSSSFIIPFPKHSDEWGHINQALGLGGGEYQWHGLPAFGLGFHLFLYGISQVADLVQIYRFLAPTWAVLSALILFFVAYSLSGKNFLIAFSTILFFGSIKSNINLLGLYFFTPLTFAIPFIFLFIFFFVRGLEKENKKYLLLSFLVILFLVPVHAISVTFALPILLFSCVLYYKYIKKKIRFFLIFLLIPLMGLFFYSFVVNLTIIDSLEILIKDLQFERGESRAFAYNDSLTVTYSIVGGILAAIGFLVILWSKKKELYPYIIWPFYLLSMILIFRITDISYLSPYHRNFYYFTISLPLLSAFGLNWVIDSLANRFKRINPVRKGGDLDSATLFKKSSGLYPSQLSQWAKLSNGVNFNFIVVLTFVIAIFFSFISYYKVPLGWPPCSRIITADDYQDLIFLAGFPKGKVLAFPLLSLAVTPITGHKVIGDYSDKFNLEHATEFFAEDEFSTEDDCHFRDALIKVYNIDYIISQHEISCGYKLLRKEHNYIYQVSSVNYK